MKSVQFILTGVLIVVLSQVLMSTAQGQGGNGGSAGQPGAPGGNGGSAGQPGAPGGNGYAGASGNGGGYQYSSASSAYVSAWSTIYVISLFSLFLIIKT
ncbi:glycine-rich protein DOT1-like [Lucilia sericata]|uniref:glycine-rich protein DOT1-like n=1 Tax=Lucilia sericata TaxID=13632 RepID=UPI0018A81D85|nr:glycine-rich protein DOT1-like [Lucilia sericata]